MAGLLQEIPAVGPLGREHGPARPVGLLLYLAGRQDRPDRLRRGVADGGAPRPEPLPVPFGVVPVRVGHVVRVGAVLASAPGPLVDGDPPAARRHGDRPRRRGHGDRALHEFERNRAPGAVEARAAVKIDRELLAGRHLAGSRRQRDEQRLFLGEEYALPAAIAPLGGRELMAATWSAGAALSSSDDMSRRFLSGSIAWRSMRPTPISTLALPLGLLALAGTTAHP